MRALPTIIALFVFHLTYCQKEANNWYFGRSAGVTFNTNPPTALSNGMINTREASATISTAQGRLLFYTDGMSVWDSTHNLMPNGTGLKGHTSTSQYIVVPRPDSPHLYYIFTLAAFMGPDGLQYSEVNMKLNNGKGDIVATRKNIKLRDSICEKISVVRHANGHDYWALVYRYKSDSIFAYKITCLGINHVPVISITGHKSSYGYIGCMKISPDGSKVAYTGYGDSSGVGNFDNTSGKVSNVWAFRNISGYGVEFSPKTRFLYIGEMNSSVGGGAIFQYDLSSTSKAAFNASKTLILKFSISSGTGAFQLGPDGKIYIAYEAPPYNGYLSVIHDPDLPKSSCNPQVAYIDLGINTSALGLPNFDQSLFQMKNTFSVDKTCIKDSARFTISEYQKADSVSWDYGDAASGSENISNKTKDVYHIYNKTGDYIVSLLSHYALRTDTFRIKIKVSPQPVKPYLGEDKILCNTNTFLIKPKNKGYLSYKWNTGSLDPQIIVSKKGMYILTVYDSTCHCCKNADSIQINFSRINAGFQLSDSLRCLKGNNFTLTDTSIIRDDGRLLSNWYFSDSTSSKDSITQKSFIRKGHYKITLKVESKNHCRDSISKNIRVLPDANAYFAINDATQCFGNNHFDFKNFTPFDSTVQHKFIWTMGDGSNDSVQTIINKRYTRDSIYTVRLISSINNYCRDTFAGQIVVNPDPKADFQVSPWIQCLKNNSADFNNLSTIKSGIISFNQWNLGDGNISTLTHIKGRKYLYPDTFIITLLTVSDNGCRDSISKKMIILPSISARFSVNRDSQCLKGNAFTFTPNSPDSSKISWQFGDGDSLNSSNPTQHKYLTPGTYYIQSIVNNYANCMDTFTKKISVLESPEALFSFKDSLPCLNDYQLNILTKSVYSNANILQQTIDWGDGMQNNLNGNGSVLHKFKKDSSYRITFISNANGCPDTSVRSIQVVLNHPVQLSVSGFCLGDTTIGKVGNGQLTIGNQYNWQIGNSKIPETGHVMKIVFPATGNYKIIVSTAFQNCNGIDSALAPIIERPVANFDFVHLPVTLTGYPYHFNDRSFNANSWQWLFSKSGTSDIQNPDYTFNDTGYTTVKLIVSNKHICYDTIEKLIPVYGRIQFFFPNAFSPDGNGVNDGFGLNPNQYYLVKGFHLEIYNRWGERIFQTDDMTQHWLASTALSKRDGPQQSVYMFKAIIRDILDERQEISGAFEVLR